MNPYEVLGVSQDASYAEIQAAYRQHALRWHPDRNANDDYAYRMMLRVNAAWEILKDGESRAAYDRWEQSGERRVRNLGLVGGVIVNVMRDRRTGAGRTGRRVRHRRR